MRSMCVALAALILAAPATAAPAAKSARDGLKPCHDLIGSWKGTGTPAGTREERDKGFWQETITWQWQFKGDDAWLRADVEKGKHFSRLELRYRPKTDDFALEATGTDKAARTFVGKLDGKKLVLDHTDEKTKQAQRLTFSLLHSNRHLIRYDTKAAGSVVFAQAWQVGATKIGVDFASVDKGPECIVSGGLGTMAVMHKGKTYYVCCSGCRDAFKDEPEKYIREFEAKKKK